jgi:hypothetical protein
MWVWASIDIDKELSMIKNVTFFVVLVIYESEPRGVKLLAKGGFRWAIESIDIEASVRHLRAEYSLDTRNEMWVVHTLPVEMLALYVIESV